MTKNLIKDYLRVIREQNKYNFVSKYDFLIVVDDAMSFYPYLKNLNVYRNCKIIESQDLFTNGFHNLSVGKNIGIDYARDNNYEWIFICDADVVVFRDFQFPKNGFCVSEWIKLNKDEKPNLNDKSLFTPSSNYLMRNDVFNKLRYNEQYYGHGWEDMEIFWVERLRHNIKCKISNKNCLHIYHDLRTFYFNDHTFERNESIFTANFMKHIGDEKLLRKILNK